MSETEESIENLIPRNELSSWEKFENFLRNDFRKDLEDSEDEDQKTVKIVVMGKTGTGKGSFINGIRGIIRKKSGQANEKNVANVTHGILPGSLNVEKYEYRDKDNNLIYFYDTGGFGDAYNKDYDVEKWLKDFQKKKKLNSMP